MGVLAPIPLVEWNIQFDFERARREPRAGRQLPARGWFAAANAASLRSCAQTCFQPSSTTVPVSRIHAQGGHVPRLDHSALATENDLQCLPMGLHARARFRTFRAPVAVDDQPTCSARLDSPARDSLVSVACKLRPTSCACLSLAAPER